MGAEGKGQGQAKALIQRRKGGLRAEGKGQGQDKGFNSTP